MNNKKENKYKKKRSKETEGGNGKERRGTKGVGRILKSARGEETLWPLITRRFSPNQRQTNVLNFDFSIIIRRKRDNVKAMKRKALYSNLAQKKR